MNCGKRKSFVVFESKSKAWDGFYSRSSSAYAAAYSLSKRFPGNWYVIQIFDDEHEKYRDDKLWWNLLAKGDKK